MLSACVLAKLAKLTNDAIPIWGSFHLARFCRPSPHLPQPLTGLSAELTRVPSRALKPSLFHHTSLALTSSRAQPFSLLLLGVHPHSIFLHPPSSLTLPIINTILVRIPPHYCRPSPPSSRIVAPGDRHLASRKPCLLNCHADSVSLISLPHLNLLNTQ